MGILFKSSNKPCPGVLTLADTPLPGGAGKEGSREFLGGGAGKLELDTVNGFFLVPKKSIITSAH